jgi:hypothetical protein
MHEPDRRTVQTGRRYELSEGDDYYGIWDRDSPGKPLETYALTDVGLEEATRRLARLSRQDFWARFSPKALRWALFGGLGVWLLGGLVLWIRYSFAGPEFGIPPGEIVAIYEEPLWAKLAQLGQDLGFRVWIGAVAILVALRLFERGRQPS